MPTQHRGHRKHPGSDISLTFVQVGHLLEGVGGTRRKDEEEGKHATGLEFETQKTPSENREVRGSGKQDWFIGSYT